MEQICVKTSASIYVATGLGLESRLAQPAKYWQTTDINCLDSFWKMKGLRLPSFASAMSWRLKLLDPATVFPHHQFEGSRSGFGRAGRSPIWNERRGTLIETTRGPEIQLGLQLTCPGAAQRGRCPCRRRRGTRRSRSAPPTGRRTTRRPKISKPERLECGREIMCRVSSMLSKTRRNAVFCWDIFRG